MSTQREIAALLREQSRRGARLRKAEVTDDSPLTVSVGGGEDVPAALIAGAGVSTGEIVDVLISGHAPPLIVKAGGAWGTALPASPSDGDIYTYNASTVVGAKWQFQYRAGSSSSYKWEFIGGAPLVAAITTQRSTTSTSYANLPTDPLTLTLPSLAGDYDIEVQATAYNGTTGYTANLSYAVGATSASDDWAAVESATVTEVSVAKRTRHAGVSSGATIAEKAKVGGGTGYFRGRRIIVWPVRVG